MDILSFKNKIYSILRNARYPYARSRLFIVDKDDNLCACALGQIALATGITTEEEARQLATGSDDKSIYDAIYARFPEYRSILERIPSRNDSLNSQTKTASFEETPKYFEAVITQIDQYIEENYV